MATLPNAVKHFLETGNIFSFVHFLFSMQGRKRFSGAKHFDRGKLFSNAKHFLKKLGHPRPLFKQTLQFLQQIYVKNDHPVYGAGIRTHDLQNSSLLP